MDILKTSLEPSKLVLASIYADSVLIDEEEENEE
jgi:hypothetical protein